MSQRNGITLFDRTYKKKKKNARKTIFFYSFKYNQKHLFLLTTFNLALGLLYINRLIENSANEVLLCSVCDLAGK